MHGRRAAAAAGRLAAAVAAALALACSTGADTPEERVRSVLAALEEAAQAKDAAGMKEHVSEGYADAQGHDKQAVAGLVTFHFLQNRSIHLLTRVRSVTVAAPGEARAEAVVAMAGTPIPAAEALPGIRADLYRFDLALREEDGVWRITGADWRPATLDDFR